MNNDWARDQLQTIRTLMERAALYRRALAPVTMVAGGLGLAAALLAWKLEFNATLHFGLYWLAVGLLALGAALLMVRRQALKEGEAFWSPPTRRVAGAMLLPMFLGAAIGVAACLVGGHDEDAWPLVVVWLALYGCALNAAGFFVRRGIRLLGWVFALAGLTMLFLPALHPDLPEGLPNLVMGATFGGLHLAYGIYLHYTEPKHSAA